MTYLKAQIKWKRSHVLTTCNAIKMPVRIAACKLPQNRANMALTFFSPFITTQKDFYLILYLLYLGLMLNEPRRGGQSTGRRWSAKHGTPAKSVV